MLWLSLLNWRHDDSLQIPERLKQQEHKLLRINKASNNRMKLNQIQ